MSQIDDLLNEIPIGDLAARLGVSEDEAKQAVSKAVPALVSGMAANAQDPLGAASLEKAIGEHNASLVEGGINLDDIDTADGEKIVKNVFGDNEEAVVNQLGGLFGGQGGGGMMASLLPMLAPLLMSFLNKSGGGGGGGGLGGPLGGLFGGGGGGGDEGGGAGGGMGDIGDVLGGLLGGGKRSAARPGG
jgi:hypothetical protein